MTFFEETDSKIVQSFGDFVQFFVIFDPRAFDPKGPAEKINDLFQGVAFGEAIFLNSAPDI